MFRLLLTGLLLSFAARAVADDDLAPGQQLIGKLPKGPRKENSGIVESRSRDNLFWMINDSGDQPRVYPINRDADGYGGHGKDESPGVLIGGVINVDWEDIAVLGDGSLVVCDIGDNRNDRRDLCVYLVPEPSPEAGRTTFLRKVFFRYPDRPSAPAPADDFNYDCEAVFAIGQKLYLLTKHRSDTATKVYRLNELTPGVVHDLELLGRFEIGGQAVAADALPDGSRVVVATYDTLWLFDSTDPDHPLANPIAKLPYKSKQVEAVCFDDPHTLLFADEAEAKLYKARVSDFEPVQ